MRGREGGSAVTEEEQNALYQKKLNVYQGTIDQIFTREKNILELIRRDGTGAAYKKIGRAHV